MPAHAAWSRRGEGERFLSGVLMHFSSRFLFVFLGFLAARSNLVTTINHDRQRGERTGHIRQSGRTHRAQLERCAGPDEGPRARE